MWIKYLVELPLVSCCTPAVCGQALISYCVGKLTVKNLRFKKGALDKLKLPVDVLEGLDILCILCISTDDLEQDTLGSFLHGFPGTI